VLPSVPVAPRRQKRSKLSKLETGSDLAKWGLPLDPERTEGLRSWGESGWRIVCYGDVRDEEFGGGEYGMPREFFYLSEEPPQKRVALYLKLERGELVCEWFAVSRVPGEPPLTTSEIRLPLQKLVRAAGERAVRKLKLVEEAGKKIAGPVDQKDRARAVALLEDARPHRGKRVSAELLQRAADVYRAAQSSGQPPLRAVEAQLHASRTTAARWLREARRRGILEEKRRP
jgi:hypothetical protein